jgi:hypothetical protein
MRQQAPALEELSVGQRTPVGAKQPAGHSGAYQRATVSTATHGTANHGNSWHATKLPVGTHPIGEETHSKYNPDQHINTQTVDRALMLQHTLSGHSNCCDNGRVCAGYIKNCKGRPKHRPRAAQACPRVQPTAPQTAPHNKQRCALPALHGSATSRTHSSPHHMLALAPLDTPQVA